MTGRAPARLAIIGGDRCATGMPRRPAWSLVARPWIVTGSPWWQR